MCIRDRPYPQSPVYRCAGDNGTVRITVRVRPGASRTRVGGAYDAPGATQLVVAVAAKAVGGAATEAVLVALAQAFGVRRRDVRLVSGATARTKIVDIDGLDADLALSLIHI